jgi:hypothetical protein
VILQVILTYTHGGINSSFSGRLRLSVIIDYPANGNRSLDRLIEILLYFYNIELMIAVKAEIRS